MRREGQIEIDGRVGMHSWDGVGAMDPSRLPSKY